MNSEMVYCNRVITFDSRLKTALFTKTDKIEQDCWVFLQAKESTVVLVTWD